MMDHDATAAGEPDPKASALLAALAALGPARDVAREDVLGAFRRHLGRLQAHVRARFESGEVGGMQAARLLASLSDGLIHALHMHSLALLGEDDATSAHLSVVATGGYGRGVLAPFSDIDLLFLTDDAPSPAVLRVVEFMLYFLWDLGLKVGHATRSLEACLTEARGDVTIRTSLMDARLIAGDKKQFTRFARDFGPPARPTAPAPIWRPSALSGRCGITATATARSWSSPTSRRAGAACVISRRCTGWRTASSASAA